MSDKCHGIKSTRFPFEIGVGGWTDNWVILYTSTVFHYQYSKSLCNILRQDKKKHKAT